MFERIFVSAYARFGEPGAWELYPDAIAFLRAVPSSTRMVVASNFDRRLLGVLEACKVRARLEAVYLSSEIGADKPSPRFFEAMIAKTGCAPGEILHVGDEPQADWEGAARAGLRVYPLQRPGMLLTDLIGPADLPVPPQ
jgi:putative hydrolase of the HAD superfamily